MDTEVAYVICDSDTTFKVKVQGQLAGGWGIFWRPPAHQLVPFIFFDCPLVMLFSSAGVTND